MLPIKYRSRLVVKIELKDGVQILFSKQDGGRLAVVQMVEA